MFIVIYKEGTQHETPLTKDSYELAMALPGDKYIFEWGNNHQYSYGLNVPSGIWFNNCLSVKPFIHGDYQLTSIKQPSKFEAEFVFRYKTIEDAVLTFSTRKYKMAEMLTLAVREIMLASKFSSWSEYQDYRATRDEIDELKAEVKRLRVENEELRQQLVTPIQN